mgnify:CR=1 FL=1
MGADVGAGQNQVGVDNLTQETAMLRSEQTIGEFRKRLALRLLYIAKQFLRTRKQSNGDLRISARQYERLRSEAERIAKKLGEIDRRAAAMQDGRSRGENQHGTKEMSIAATTHPTGPSAWCSLN